MLLRNGRAYYFVITALLIIAGTSLLPAQDSIDKRIVLRAGNVSITGYELEKNLKLFREIFLQNNGHPAGPADVEKWLYSFRDRALFLADAYHKGYDTIVSIDKWVESMAHYVISREGGLLEERNMKVSFTPQETAAALQKNSRKVHIRYLKFADYNAAINFLNGNIIVKNEKEFRKLMQRSAQAKGITTGEDILQWPFFSRGENEEILFNLAEGGISDLLPLANGYYIAQVTKIENEYSAGQPDSLKTRLMEVLKQQRIQQMRSRYYDEIKNKAQIKINPAFLSAVEKYLKNNGVIRSFDQSQFAGEAPASVMTYVMEGQAKEVPLQEFMDYYNYLTLRRQVVSTDMVVFYLQAMVFDAYNYRNAMQSGITDEPKFLLDRDNYKKNVIWAAYEREELKKGITISEDEINARYALAKVNFQQPADIVVSVFSFAGRRSAMMGMMNMQRDKSDTVAFENVQDVVRHRHVHYSDEFYSDSLKAVVFAMKNNEVLRPVNVKGKFIVVLKEAGSGSRIQELEEVRPVIIRELENEKLEQIKRECLSRLKTLYEVKDEIEYGK